MTKFISSENYIFTYGTLKRGYGNNRCLSNSEFVGEAISAGATYRLFSSGIPYLTECGSSGAKIKGEIFEPTAEDFARCDRLEGHPYAYCREKRLFLVGDRAIEAWVYFYRDAKRWPARECVPPVNGIIEWQPNRDPQPRNADRYLA